MSAPATRRTLHDVGTELQLVAREAEASQREAAARAAEESAVNGSGGGGLSEVAQTAIRQKAWRVERDALRARLEDEIVELHERLGTGVSRPALPRLAMLLAAHDPEAFAKPEASIEEQIEGAVLAFLSRKTGERAWERVKGLMARAGMTWPVPDGLGVNRSTEELGAVVLQHEDEVHGDFLAAGAARLSGLVRGEVAAWKYAYPPPGSYLWRHTALRGVAAGLRGQLFAAALESWMWRPPELEVRLLSALDTELQSAREELGAERGSLRAAIDVAARVARACGTVAPAIVWEFVEPRLSWDGPGPTVLSLAEGLTGVDPVCGMSLSASMVRARSEHRGAVCFFCSESCAEQYRASPALSAASEAELPGGGDGSV